MKHSETPAIAELTPVMTVAEAAKCLRVNRLTILSLIHNKGLPAFKVGSDWRLTRKAVDKWIATLRGPGEMKPRGAAKRKKNEAREKP